MIDVFTELPASAAESDSPFNEDDPFYQLAYAMEPSLENTKFSFDLGAPGTRIIGNWPDGDRNLHAFITGMLAKQNLRRPPRISNTSWDYAYRLPIQLDKEEILEIEIALRDNQFPQLETPDIDEQYQDYNITADFVKEANEALDAGKYVYYVAWAYK
jgi:hypothetical protein